MIVNFFPGHRSSFCSCLSVYLCLNGIGNPQQVLLIQEISHLPKIIQEISSAKIIQEINYLPQSFRISVALCHHYHWRNWPSTICHQDNENVDKSNVLWTLVPKREGKHDNTKIYFHWKFLSSNLVIFDPVSSFCLFSSGDGGYMQFFIKGDYKHPKNA